MAKACRLERGKRYVRMRRRALVVIVAVACVIGGIIAMALDSLAESVCVDQLDAQARWAVSESKRMGVYPDGI